MNLKKFGRCALGVLVCAVTLATAAFAAGSVKFGIEDGDKLTFAGSDEPIVWNVVLSDKTNTDDESGMLLLADNLMGTAENTTSSTSGLKAAFTACYDKEFSDLQKSAALRVTKKDAPKKLTFLLYGVQPFSVWCDGALNGEVLFALSYEEASLLPMAKLAAESPWWLRTVGDVPYDCYTYVATNGALSTAGYAPTCSLRPAVNLKKAAFNVHSVAGEAPLLLPVDAAESSSTFTAVTNNATAWKLNLPQTDITISSVQTNVASDNSLSYDIRLNAAAGENGGLSFIIVKPDGTVSYYMRKIFETTPQTDLAGTFALPSDVDKENDKMYVFYERSVGKFSGEISELAEICLSHKYQVKDLFDTVHKYTCTTCGKSYTEAHDYTVSETSADGHTMVCSVCGGVHTLAHTFKAVRIDNADEHRLVCTVCNYAGDYKEHTYAFEYEDYKHHKRYCTECGAYGYMKHNFDDYVPYEIDTTQWHAHTCVDCGWFSYYKHDIVCTDLGYDEGHERACTECSYKETLAHTFDTTAYPDKHIQICGACRARYELPHIYGGEVTEVDETYHSTTCSVCGYVQKEKHDLVYTALSDGLRHAYACADCTYGGKTALHTFVYDTDYTVPGFKTAHCVCGVTGDTAAAPGKPAEDIAIVRDIIDEYSIRLSAGESTGMNGYQCLFTDKYGGDFLGRSVQDSGSDRYSIRFTFKTKKAFTCTGLWIRLSDISYAVDPYSVILYGRETEESDYVKIGEATLSYFGTEDTNRNGTYLFTGAGLKAYADYRLDLVGSTNAEMKLGNAYLLGLPTSNVNYQLSGVMLAEEEPVSQIAPGDDLSVTLLSQNGHPAKENVTVLENGVSFSGFTYSEETGLLVVDGASIGSGKTYTVKAIAPSKLVRVTTELDGISFEGASYAAFGTEYTAYLTDSLGDTTYLPYELTVTIGGKAFDDYEFAQWKGEFSIPGSAITGDIVIKGGETGRANPADAFFSVEREGESIRYYDNADDFYHQMNRASSVITLLKDLEVLSDISNDDGTVVLDLNGHTLTQGTDLCFKVPDNSELTVKNGTLRFNEESYGYVSYDGILCLENVTVSRDVSSEDPVFALNGKLYLKDCTFTSEIYVDGFMSVENSTFTSLQLGVGAKGAFYSGTIGELRYDEYENVPTIFDLLAENTALYIESANAETLAALVDKTDFAPAGGIVIKPADGILTSEPQEATVPYNSGETVTLAVKASGEGEYRWYGPDGKIENADGTLKVETADLALGKYDYTCYVRSGNYLVKTHASVTVECAHETVDENGVCENCGTLLCIEVTDANGTTKLYGDIEAALDSVQNKSGSTIRLLRDTVFSGNGAFSGSYRELYLSGDNITFDLNGKTFKIENQNSDIYVNGTYIVKNGTLDAPVRFTDFQETGYLTVENVDFLKLFLVDRNRVCLESGKFTYLRMLYGDFADALGEGKAYYFYEDNVWYDGAYKSSLENVEVRNAPVNIVTQPKSLLLGAEESGTMAVEAVKAAGFEDKEITYQWYETEYEYTLEYGWQGSCIFSSGTKLEGQTASALVFPDTVGENKYYYCEVTVDGYTVKSDIAAYRRGVGSPVLTVGNADNLRYGFFSVDPQGRDCIVVIAGFKNGRYVRMKTIFVDGDRKLYGERLLNLDFDASYFDEVRIFVVESIETFKPLCESASVYKPKN